MKKILTGEWKQLYEMAQKKHLQGGLLFQNTASNPRVLEVNRRFNENLLTYLYNLQKVRKKPSQKESENKINKLWVRTVWELVKERGNAFDFQLIIQSINAAKITSCIHNGGEVDGNLIFPRIEVILNIEVTTLSQGDVNIMQDFFWCRGFRY